MKVKDKCPKCHEGLLAEGKDNLICDSCFEEFPLGKSTPSKETETIETPIETEEKFVKEIKEIVDKAPVKKEVKKEESVYEKLSKPIDEKDIIEYEEDGKRFKGYNAQAAINRLNDVLGFENWTTKTEMRKEELLNGAWAVSMVITLKLTYRGKEVLIEGSGGSYAKNIANAYKGARTSAFKNACRFLGIGKELYEENIDDDLPTSKVIQEEEPKKEMSGEYANLAKKIEESKTIEQLQSLEAKVKEITDPISSKEMCTIYNKKKIELIV